MIYLGLSVHPDVITARLPNISKSMVQEHVPRGWLAGIYFAHDELEEKLARFF